MATTEIDLFGEVPAINTVPAGKKGRKSGGRAYPAPPGTGPADRQCKHCASYVVIETRASNTYRKCERMRPVWSHGAATDIKARAPACRLFTPPESLPPVPVPGPAPHSVNRHTCHAEGCEVGVAPKLLMCLKHWRMVPKPLQVQVWRHYRPGQENDKRPTAEYLEAARAAIDAVAGRR